MQKAKTEMDDELRPEYDLRNLRVRKVGPKRKSFSEQSVWQFPRQLNLFIKKNRMKER